MKTFPLLILATSFLFAQEEQSCSPPPFAYNTPSRVNLSNNWDVYTDFNFLYWVATQSNMEIGIISDQTDPDYFLNGTINKLDFQYQPGFQVGLGVNLNRDQWDLFLRYTWFHNTASSTVSLNPDGFKILFPSWQLPDLFVAYFDGQEKWDMNMDYLDFELGRAYAVGVDLRYRPFIGIRGILISQEIKAHYENVTSIAFLPRNQVFVEQSADSWGIGPRAGIETNWNLGAGFCIFGNGGVDLLFTEYTKLKTLQKGTNLIGEELPRTRIFIKEPDNQHIRAHFDLELGLGYGTYFACRKAHMNLDIGYIFQVFFDQNMFRSFVDDQTLGKANSPHGNLYIHGLTLSLRFDL